MHAPIKMERVEELVVWTANQAWEELPIHCGHAHYEVFPCQHSVKIMSEHHIRGHGEP